MHLYKEKKFLSEDNSFQCDKVVMLLKTWKFLSTFIQRIKPVLKLWVSTQSVLVHEENRTCSNYSCLSFESEEIRELLPGLNKSVFLTICD